MSFLTLGEEYDLGLVEIVNYAVYGGKVGGSGIDINLGERAATCKYTGDLGNVCGKIYLLERSTVLERISAEYKLLGACFEVKSIKFGAVSKYGCTKLGHSCGNSELLNGGTTHERTFAKLCKAAAGCEHYGFKVRTVSECILTCDKILISSTCKDNGFEILKAVECTFADKNKRAGKNYLVKRIAAYECACINVSCTLGNNVSTGHRRGSKKKRSAILREENVVNRLVILVIGSYVDSLKSGTAIECVLAFGNVYVSAADSISLKLNFCKSCGKSYLHKLGTVHKCSRSDSKRSGRTVLRNLKDNG